jgi:thiamine biosynthesis lipoprotein
MERRAFRAMGTDMELLVDAGGADDALDAAEAELHRLEAILSRFRPESELSRLNASGTAVAGPELLELTNLSLAARELTGGRFDPTVHDAVVGAGYDRTFDSLPAEGPEPRPAAGGGRVTVSGDRIELEPGVRLDFGGIAKGWAADRAADLLGTAGPCLVNAGGDIAVRGGAWPVGVETAGEPFTLELTGGGLATSGRDRRTWRRGGREVHHIVDPATGAPAESDLLRTTVVAANAVAAEVWAKALFLEGKAAAAAEADRRGLPAVLVSADGETQLAGGLA